MGRRTVQWKSSGPCARIALRLRAACLLRRNAFPACWQRRRWEPCSACSGANLLNRFIFRTTAPPGDWAPFLARPLRSLGHLPNPSRMSRRSLCVCERSKAYLRQGQNGLMATRLVSQLCARLGFHATQHIMSMPRTHHYRKHHTGSCSPNC